SGRPRVYFNQCGGSSPFFVPSRGRRSVACSLCRMRQLVQASRLGELAARRTQGDKGVGTNDVSEGSVRTKIEGASRPYPSQEMPKHPGVVYRHWLGLLLALGLTAGAFYFAIRGIDTAALWRRVANQNHPLIIVAALLLVVQILFGAERWR